MFIDTIYNDPDFLEHHGIKGMRWGVRRYQNYDGSLKSAGKAHLAANAKRPNSSSEYNKIKNTVPKNYGSVQIKKRTDTDSYVISDGKYIVRTNQDLKENQQAVADMLNSTVGLTTEREVEKYFKKNPDELEDYKELLNFYMEMSWSNIVKEEGKDTKATREKKAAEAAERKKQEDAINSVYAELEKDPKFNKMSEAEQDYAFIEYVNSHPELSRRIFGD